ncbi:peroxiredoxin [Thioalkalivibrio sp. ALJT]|uniref:peroxiredoxin n=1 Tax=Thioalkalivibrio sp. ALJT TaxID=1158146 RepID=UPI00037952D2|nr:peroxiredoxin [Thioalkalivibrio sp. ALJT]
MSIAIDQIVPEELRVPATGEQELGPGDFRGRIVVLYFYPKDNTPGCTNESRDFAANLGAFDAAGAVILGVSRDSVKSHENFRQKQELPFDLLSDADEKLCAAFDVIKMKNMYGKQVRGIERSTFLVDPDGVLRREWRKVKVPGHVDEVLAAVRELAGN